MKETFKAFYPPTNDQVKKGWESDKTLFIFDTNILLNFYGYAEETREDLFKILESIKDKIWIPYHVGLEYQRNRLEVIKREKAIFNEIRKSIDQIDSIFKDEISTFKLEERIPELHDQTERLRKNIANNVKKYKRILDTKDDIQPCVRSDDEIRKQFDNLFEGKIGIPPKDQKYLDQLFKEGEDRYKYNAPPGFEDKNKENKDDNFFYFSGLKYQRKFGDYIIWKQILEYLADKEVENVFFITDDKKSDWWSIVDSRGKKYIGPRAELKEEVFKTGHISLFQMYSTYDFMKNAKSMLSIDINENSIEEAQLNRRDIAKILLNNKLKYGFYDHELKRKVAEVNALDALNRYENIKNLFGLDAYKNLSASFGLDAYKNLSASFGLDAYKNLSASLGLDAYKNISDYFKNNINKDLSNYNDKDLNIYDDRDRLEDNKPDDV